MAPDLLNHDFIESSRHQRRRQRCCRRRRKCRRRCRRRSTFRRWTTRRRRQQDSGHVHLTLLLREGNGGHVAVDAAATAAEVAVELSDQVVVELRQSRPLSCSGDAALKNNRVVVGLTCLAHRSMFSMAASEMRNLTKRRDYEV